MDDTQIKLIFDNPLFIELYNRNNDYNKKLIMQKIKNGPSSSDGPGEIYGRA